MLSINEMVDRIRVVNQCMKHSIKEHDPDDSINEFLKEIGTAVNASAIYLYTLKKIMIMYVALPGFRKRIRRMNQC